jgi:hypothetical protein
MTTYTHISDLAKEAEPPEKGILSRTIFNDEKVKAVIFGFWPGRGAFRTHRLHACHPAIHPGRGDRGPGRRQARGEGWNLGPHAHRPATQHPGENAGGYAVAAVETANRSSEKRRVSLIEGRSSRFNDETIATAIR